MLTPTKTPNPKDPAWEHAPPPASQKQPEDQTMPQYPTLFFSLSL
jgi:hypothetical protein